MTVLRFVFVPVVMALALVACETPDGGRRKKKTRPPLPGEEASDLSWGRPTKASDISSPFGLPTSR
jgi:hypothetical protein